jgi:hypothetical protein
MAHPVCIPMVQNGNIAENQDVNHHVKSIILSDGGGVTV